jgi:hypothetical protein
MLTDLSFLSPPYRVHQNADPATDSRHRIRHQRWQRLLFHLCFTYEVNQVVVSSLDVHQTPTRPIRARHGQGIATLPYRVTPSHHVYGRALLLALDHPINSIDVLTGVSRV